MTHPDHCGICNTPIGTDPHHVHKGTKYCLKGCADLIIRNARWQNEDLSDIWDDIA